MAASGGVINKHIVKATADGILKHHMPTTYHTLEISDSWARSLLNRMDMVKRKGSHFRVVSKLTIFSYI